MHANELPTPPAESLAHHRAYLRARLRGLGVAEANLDDAVQDVFEVLVRRIRDYDSRFSLRQWMAGVARKVARRHREHERRAPLMIDEARLPAATPDPEHAAARGEGLALLRRFLAGLDADRWAVFVLSEIEGLRGTEIAAELDLNLSTVYARLRAARHAFEAAAAAQRGPGRAWLEALLVGPSALFRRRGGAAFTTPLALGALLSVGLGVGLGARACHEPPPGAAQPRGAAPATVPSPPAASAGVARRAVDPARLLPARPGRGDEPPVADADGWFAGSSGSSEGPGAWSHRHVYKLAGAELMVRVEYHNDDDVPIQAVGWLDLDGLALVDGELDWPIDLAVDEDRAMHWRLRATRAGVVRAALGHGWTRDGEVHALHSFVHEGGALRPCRAHECARVIAAHEHTPGPRILVELRNDCDRALEIFEVPPGADLPPRDAPRHRLAAGERRDVEIDATMQLMHRDRHDEFGGSIAADTAGARFRFFGADCSSRSVDTPTPPRG